MRRCERDAEQFVVARPHDQGIVLKLRHSPDLSQGIAGYRPPGLCRPSPRRGDVTALAMMAPATERLPRLLVAEQGRQSTTPVAAECRPDVAAPIFPVPRCIAGA